MPRIDDGREFMGQFMENMLQLPPEQLLGENCIFTEMNMNLILPDKTLFGSVPVTSSMKKNFFRIAVTQSTGIEQDVMKQLKIGEYLDALYRNKGHQKTFTYAL